MTDKSSQSKVHEVTDSDLSLPVASPQYLLSQVLDRLARLEEENRALKEEVATLREENALERAYDRQRLARLETPAPALREETAEDHINRLFLAMRSQGVRQTTTKGAARLLGVSKPLIDKIKPYLATDPRFVILRDPSHKQRHLIRLAGT